MWLELLHFMSCDVMSGHVLSSRFYKIVCILSCHVIPCHEM